MPVAADLRRDIADSPLDRLSAFGIGLALPCFAIVPLRGLPAAIPVNRWLTRTGLKENGGRCVAPAACRFGRTERAPTGSVLGRRRPCPRRRSSTDEQ